MATRTSLRPQIVLSAGDMSTNLTSIPTILASLSMCSYSLSWAGSTPVGSVSIQCSNDFSLNPDGTVNNLGTWSVMTVQLAGVPVSVIPITGNTGTGFIDITETAAYAIRLIFTKGSGTGNLSVTFNGKVA